MTPIETASAVAAIWFVIFFGACLLAPLFTLPCKAARKRRHRNDD